MDSTNYVLAKDFEYYGVDQLNSAEYKIGTTIYNFKHWNNVSHEMLYLMGIINNYNKYRLLKVQSIKSDNINLVRDVGIDFVGYNNYSNNYIAGQCKLYETNVSYDDVGTWFGELLVMKTKNVLNTGILCTINNISVKLFETMSAVGLNHIKYDRNHFLDWNEERKRIMNYDEEKEVNCIRRDYQVDVVKRTVYHFESTTSLNEERKVVLNLVCSLGKTLLIGDTLAKLKPNCVIMMAPYKTDVENLFYRIPAFLKENYDFLLFDSDKSANINIVLSAIENCIKLNRKLVIFTTFKSALEKIAKYLYSDSTETDNADENIVSESEDEFIIDEDFDDTLDNKEDEDDDEDEGISDLEEEVENDKIKDFLKNAFIVVDEVHEISVKRKELLNLINDCKKGLFCTATLPKRFKEYINYTLCINEYDFNYALNNKYIVDYKIMIPIALTKDETLEEVYKLVKNGDLSIIQKAAFLIKGMLQTGSRRCIVYLSTKDECIKFCESFSKVGLEYHGEKIETYRINDDITIDQRKRIIKGFEDGDDDSLKIIASCQCLNQAVNIVRCDSTFMPNVTKSTDEIVIFQRFMRASRIDPINKSKINTCFLFCENDDFNSLENCLTKLKNGLKDECFDKKVFVVNQTYDNQDKIEVKERIVEKQKTINNCLIEWIEFNLKERWERIINFAIKFCEDNNISKDKFYPNNKSNNEEEKKLSSTLNRYKCKNNKSEEITNLIKEFFPHWLLKNKELDEYICFCKWQNIIKETIEFCKVNNINIKHIFPYDVCKKYGDDIITFKIKNIKNKYVSVEKLINEQFSHWLLKDKELFNYKSMIEWNKVINFALDYCEKNKIKHSQFIISEGTGIPEINSIAKKVGPIKTEFAERYNEAVKLINKYFPHWLYKDERLKEYKEYISWEQLIDECKIYCDKNSIKLEHFFPTKTYNKHLYHKIDGYKRKAIVNYESITNLINSNFPHWLYSGEELDEYNNLVKWMNFEDEVKQYCNKNKLNIKNFKPTRTMEDNMKTVNRAIESYRLALKNKDSKYKTYKKVTEFIKNNFPHWLA